MVQRFIRLLGWVCYSLGAIILGFISTGLVTDQFFFYVYLAIALTSFLIGRGIIYVAVGPRRNPF